MNKEEQRFALQVVILAKMRQRIYDTANLEDGSDSAVEVDRPLFGCWHELDMLRKWRIVIQIAEYAVYVFDQSLDGIASLSPAAADVPDKRPELLGMTSTSAARP
ncbi:hypothetical protein PG988_007434 [Apiospora saccharicola]